MRKRGRGMACCWYGIARTATIDRAGAWAELDDGGTAKVMVGVTEIGEGILTVLSQIAAEELGVRPDDVTLGDNDTARVPEAAHAGATRQTYMCGNAVALACRDAFARLERQIQIYWGVSTPLKAHAGEIWCPDHPELRMTMDQAVAICKGRGVVPVGSGSFTADHTSLDPETGEGKPWQAYVFGTQIVDVEVDTHTGEVQVLSVVAAHDVGRAVNPQGVEGQIQGGVVMGIGYGIMEEYVLEEGEPKTHGFSKYILPTALDIPDITSLIIEDADPHSPIGAKGIGEPAMLATAPAIVNAIHDAIGVRITELPATPERVLEAIRKKNQNVPSASGEPLLRP